PDTLTHPIGWATRTLLERRVPRMRTAARINAPPKYCSNDKTTPKNTNAPIDATIGSAALATPTSVAESPLKPYKYKPTDRIVPTPIPSLIRKIKSSIPAMVSGSLYWNNDPTPNGKTANPPNTNPQDKTQREPY